MRPLDRRFALLEFLGELFRDISSEVPDKYPRQAQQLQDQLKTISHLNPWFTSDSVYLAISNWGQSLTSNSILSWASGYDLPGDFVIPKTVMVIMAGNIPMVGFHDFLCTILSGHRFVGKLSSRDRILFPMVIEWILEFDQDWKTFLQFATSIPPDPEIIIATGSNNTSRLISQRFAGRSMIVRHNRNSIGLLSGEESESELENLADDILLYYGLGCRNVSMILLPVGFELSTLTRIIERTDMILPSPFENNLKYQRAKAGMHDIPFTDAGKILFINKNELNSPLGIIHFSYYKNPFEAELFRTENSNQIQLTVGNPAVWKNVIPFGNSQKPGLSDYADGVDTLEFLINMS